MYYTKEQQLEKALLEFTNLVMEATLKVADDLRKEGKEEQGKAFATGVVCMVDGNANRGPVRGYGVTKP
jgi:hypothetical protein